MGQAAEDLADLEWKQSMPRSEINPHGYRSDSYWTTRDGTKIKLSKMESSHIRNCINLLNRSKIDPYDVVGDNNFSFTIYQIEQCNREIDHNIRLFEEELMSRGHLEEYTVYESSLIYHKSGGSK